jgi:hypothetical protein
VQVVQVEEDPQQLGVELRVADLRKPEPKEAQPLAWLDRVHRALVQQMDVQPVDHGGRLLDEQLALLLGERVALDELAELGQRSDRAEVVVRLEHQLRRGVIVCPPSAGPFCRLIQGIRRFLRRQATIAVP